MYTVYVLRSKGYPDKLYIGTTKNLEARLTEHNRGTVSYSKRYSPWDIELTICLRHKKTAFHFEKYLKSGSGQAFLKKRLLP